MSKQTIVTNTGLQAHITTDTKKIFLWENRYITAPLNNSAYDDVTIPAGTVMGRVTSTGYVKPLRSTYSDGSEIPVGILADDYTVDGGALIDVSLCNYGDINENAIIFENGTDNLDTTVSGQRLRDRLHNIGLRIIPSDEQTGTDNE